MENTEPPLTEGSVRAGGSPSNGESNRVVDVPSEEELSKRSVTMPKAELNRRPTGRAVLSLVDSDFQPREQSHLASLPDLSLEAGEDILRTNLRANIWVPLGDRTTTFLPSTAAYITAHLKGRVGLVFLEEDEFHLEFLVAARSAQALEMVESFAQGMVSFLGLPADTAVSFSIDSVEEMEASLPEQRRKGLDF